jgi:nucleoid DNA-binding protein
LKKKGKYDEVGVDRTNCHPSRLLSSKDVELAIKTMLEQMSQCLATGDRIEIRGFGSFSLHYRAPRVGRNPKPVSPSASTASSFRISSRERIA